MTTDPALTIRPILAKDEAHWRALWCAYLAFYDTVLPEDTYRDTFGRIVTGGHGLFGQIAVLGDTPVGLVHYLSHGTFWKPGATCYLQDLFTAPGMRGRGVARALMQAVFADAAGQGIADVYWLTAETNYAGRMLYDQLGTKTPFIVYERGA